MAFAAPAKVVGLSERHPTAALAVMVPGSLIAMAAVAAYPLVFVSSLFLLALALVASIRYEEARTETEVVHRSAGHSRLTAERPEEQCRNRESPRCCFW